MIYRWFFVTHPRPCTTF